MDVPADLYGKWQEQHAAAERSRMLAQINTERMLARAKARVVSALRALEVAARIDRPPT